MLILLPSSRGEWWKKRSIVVIGGGGDVSGVSGVSRSGFMMMVR